MRMLLLILLAPALSGADATFTFANDRLSVTFGDKSCGILVVEKGSKLVADGQMIMRDNASGMRRAEDVNFVITDEVIKAAADGETGYDLIEELQTNKRGFGFTKELVDEYLVIARALGMEGSFVVTNGDYRVCQNTVVDLSHLDSAKYTAYFLTEIAKSEGCQFLYMRVKLIR